MEFIYSTRNPDCPLAYARFGGMHTDCELLLAHCAEQEARSWSEAVEEMVRTAGQRYNRFDPESLLSRINREASLKEVPCDEELFLILQLCRAFQKATRGWFDISANPSSRSAGTGSWELDSGKRTVRFSREDMRLDLGGFLKGYVLEQVLKTLPLPSGQALLSLGGSSSYARGHHPLSDNWPVSLPHSYYPLQNACTFQLLDQALSVSGKDRCGNGHIINPKNGNRVEKEEMVTVIGPSPLVCEVLSTALWVCDEAHRSPLLSDFEGYQANSITPLPDGSAIVRKI